jgi:hypothetical protein
VTTENSVAMDEVATIAAAQVNETPAAVPPAPTLAAEPREERDAETLVGQRLADKMIGAYRAGEPWHAGWFAGATPPQLVEAGRLFGTTLPGPFDQDAVFVSHGRHLPRVTWRRIAWAIEVKLRLRPLLGAIQGAFAVLYRPATPLGFSLSLPHDPTGDTVYVLHRNHESDLAFRAYRVAVVDGVTRIGGPAPGHGPRGLDVAVRNLAQIPAVPGETDGHGWKAHWLAVNPAPNQGKRPGHDDFETAMWLARTLHAYGRRVLAENSLRALAATHTGNDVNDLLDRRALLGPTIHGAVDAAVHDDDIAAALFDDVGHPRFPVPVYGFVGDVPEGTAKHVRTAGSFRVGFVPRAPLTAAQVAEVEASPHPARRVSWLKADGYDGPPVLMFMGRDRVDEGKYAGQDPIVKVPRPDGGWDVVIRLARRGPDGKPAFVTVPASVAFPVDGGGGGLTYIPRAQVAVCGSRALRAEDFMGRAGHTAWNLVSFAGGQAKAPAAVVPR